MRKEVISRRSIRNSLSMLNLILWALLIVAAPISADTLTQRLDAVLSDSCLNYSLQGVVVRSIKTGEYLYERNADTTLVPASNLKLLISAAILDKLGPDFSFKTNVYVNNKADEKGILAGDVILKGGGDPVLETVDLEKLTGEIKNKGIRKITGNIIVDDTHFDDQRLGWGWSWDDIPYYYSAEISALNLNRNVVDVYVSPGKTAGAPAVIKINPSTNYVTVKNTAITGKAGSEKTVSVYREIGRNVITIKGSVPIGYKSSEPEEPITVIDPASYTGNILKSLLKDKGISVLGGVIRGNTPAAAKLLCSHTSPPISKIIALLNKPSDNLIAEVLLKVLGIEVRGKGTSADGELAEIEFFKQAGVDTTALKIIDGSGLSRINLITPRNLAILLSYMHGHKYGRSYMDSLPVAGVDGSIRNRMKGTAAEGNVRAKTGYMSGVSTLSGYVTTKSGEPLAFSIMINNYLCDRSLVTAVQDKICVALAEVS